MNSKSRSAAPLSVVGVRDTWAPEVAHLLEPGEAVQVIVPARTGMGRATLGYLESYVPTLNGGRHALLVATDRCWLPVVRPEKASETMTPGARSRRDIRVSVSSMRRFDGFDQPYSIDPLWTDHVRAANDALDAASRGAPFELYACGDWVLTDPKKSRGLLRSVFSRGR